MSVKGTGPAGESPRVNPLKDYIEKGKAFVEDLMRENERLRWTTARLRQENEELRRGSERERTAALKAENARLKERLEAIEGRFVEIERENMDFANRYVEVQQQNDNLMNLYVASYQLHSSLNPDAVVMVIQEILLNLVGAGEFFIFMKDRKKGSISIIAGEGPDGPVGRTNVREIDAVLAGVLERGEPFFRSGQAPGECRHLACTPLRVNEEVVGAISIIRLLNQKQSGLTPVDHEILSLLSDHAAAALVSADLYSRTERKLRTVESFIDLLKAGDSRSSNGGGEKVLGQGGI